MKFLVTGAAGFIGYHISAKLLKEGHQVIGLDNLSDYYDIKLKKMRLDQLKKLCSNFVFYKCDLSDSKDIFDLFFSEKFEQVIHLGAQPGVRFSVSNPLVYAYSNIVGYINVLEGCRKNDVKHLIYASSSSIYGLNHMDISNEFSITDYPISLYGATKKSNELMAYVYSYLYQLPTTGLRFFTVYGPWGRPDMAIFKFTKAMLEGKTINLYNYGNMKRSFTFIDDVVKVIMRVKNLIPLYLDKKNDICCSSREFRVEKIYHIYNVGNIQTISILKCVKVLEKVLGINAKKNLVPMQQGDMLETKADNSLLRQKIGFEPKTSILIGIKKFVQWYLKYCSIKKSKNFKL